MPRLPIPSDSSYSSSRLPASEQRALNLYKHEQRGWRQYPGLSEFAAVTVAAPTYNQTGTLGAATNAIAFSSDGLKLFGLETATDRIVSYTLGTAWDVSTIGASTTHTFTYAAGLTPFNMYWKPDGTELYIGDLDRKIYQLTAGTAWDISTLTYNSVFLDVIGEATGGGVNGLALSPDGAKMYVLGSSSGLQIFQYTLTTPWNVSTAVYDSKTFSPTETVGRGLGISASGGKLWVVGNNTEDAIQQINLVSREDVSASYTGTTFDASAQDNQFSGGITFGDSGDKFYLADFSNIYEYDAGAPYTFGNSAQGRGSAVMDGVYYTVMDNTLYSVSLGGVVTSIGDVAGFETAIMETDGVQLVITTGVTGGTIYVYTVAAGLVTVTDAEVEDTAKSSAYLDLAFYLDQSAGQFIASDNNDATTYSLDDKIEAESFADDILRMFAHNQLLYAFGQTSTEVFYTSGVGRPPIERQQVIERGIVGSTAVASIDDMIFFVDQFGRPNMMSGLEYRPIYEAGMAEAWSEYSTLADCVVMPYSDSQQTFIEFAFPSANATWTYAVEKNTWSEREDASGGRFRAISYANVYNKLLAQDYSNGKIYNLSESTYQDDSADITRTLDSGLITSEIFGDPSIYGSEMACNSFKITVESTAAATLTISFAKDGGAFAQTRTMTLTPGVQTRELSAWGKFREGIFRITTTTNAGIDIIDLAADLEVLDS